MYQFLPVVSLFAGVSLAVAFIENARKPSTLRKYVVCLLSTASILLVCSISAAAIFAIRIAPVKIRIEQGMTPKTDDVIPSLLKQSNLSTLFDIGVLCALYGFILVFLAIAIAGYAQGRKEGMIITLATFLGAMLIVICFFL